MGKIATDIYTFENLRREGFPYVDKTGILWSLVNMSIGKQFFLARPRRFGKSLLVSTLRSLFEGKCELFAGLAIEPKWDWSRSWPLFKIGCAFDWEKRNLGQWIVFVGTKHKPLLV